MPKVTRAEEIESFLSYRLAIIARLINRRSTRYFNEAHGLTLAEWRALTQVALGRATTVNAIAIHTSSDKAQVSRAVAGLLKKGLIEATPHPSDGRSTEFALTQKGAVLHGEILPMRADENATIAALMTPEELRLFNDVLDRMQVHLQSLD